MADEMPTPEDIAQPAEQSLHITPIEATEAAIESARQRDLAELRAFQEYTENFGLTAREEFNNNPEFWRLYRREFEHMLEDLVQAIPDWETIQPVTLKVALRVAQEKMELIERTKRAEMMAETDPMTQLKNRLGFDRFWEELGEDDATAFFFDLDGFKPVNDGFGHAAGDDLLRQLSERLDKVLRDKDGKFRFGGDEFVGVVIGSEDKAVADEVERRLRQKLTEPYIVNGQSVKIGVSLGRSYRQGRGYEDVLKEADAASYQEKMAKKQPNSR